MSYGVMNMWQQSQLDRNLFIPDKSSRFVEFTYQSREIDKLIEYLNFFSDQENIEEIINLLVATKKALIGISINKNIKTHLVDLEEEIKSLKSIGSTSPSENFLQSAISYAVACIDYNLNRLGNKEIFEYWSNTQQDIKLSFNK